MHKTVTFTLLYDKPALPSFQSGWGLSLFIEFANKNILFDTGWNGKMLLSNLIRANIKLDKINHIFLSHSHWDHIGGIVYILNQELKSLESIIVPQSFSNHFKRELGNFTHIVEIRKSDQPLELFSRFWSSGELGKAIPEHSLILQMASNRLFVVTGCAHPQVDKILAQSSKLGSIYGVIGGFHDFKELEKLSAIRVIIPLHCTKMREEIFTRFPDSTTRLQVGERYSLTLAKGK